MKVEFTGKYEWWGVYIDEGGEEIEFTVFADDIRHAIDLDPVPGEIVELERVQEAEEGLELPDDLAERLIAQTRRKLN